jgi:two-component system, NtrC family, response regulator HydG
MKTPIEGHRILLVDDSPDTLEVLERNLTARDFQVCTALSAKEAMDLLSRSPVDVVVTDMRMPGMSGLELVRHVRASYPGTAVMMITGYATIDGAVEAVKTGVEEYLAKPFTEEELAAAIGRTIARLEAVRARSAGRGPDRFGMVGRSAGMRRAFEAMERAAASPHPTLILGERGTGRTLAARALHGAGPRSSRPFIVLDCDSAPQGLQLAQLEQALDLAGEGTLFVRYVERADPEVQRHLLALLGEGPRGPKIIASGGPELTELIAGRAEPAAVGELFASEPVLLPALRERREDILPLAGHFAERDARLLGKPSPELSEALGAALRMYSWPGNVAELRDAIAGGLRACAGDALELEHLPGPVRAALAAGAASRRTLAEAEAAYVGEVLAAVGGNKSRAAEILGIDRKTLREKLKP